MIDVLENKLNVALKAENFWCSYPCHSTSLGPTLVLLRNMTEASDLWPQLLGRSAIEAW